MAQINNTFLTNPILIMLVTLLGPKCYVYRKVEQVDLDQHKSLSLNNINCNVPLADLSKLFLF